MRQGADEKVGNGQSSDDWFDEDIDGQRTGRDDQETVGEGTGFPGGKIWCRDMDTREGNEG